MQSHFVKVSQYFHTKSLLWESLSFSEMSFYLDDYNEAFFKKKKKIEKLFH